MVTTCCTVTVKFSSVMLVHGPITFRKRKFSKVINTATTLIEIVDEVSVVIEHLTANANGATDLGSIPA